MYVGTSHDHDQPAHLRVKEELQHVPSGAAEPIHVSINKINFLIALIFVADVSIKEFAGPEQRYGLFIREFTLIHTFIDYLMG
jgi:hypothetical protein